jgi:hypothetical protein
MVLKVLAESNDSKFSSVLYEQCLYNEILDEELLAILVNNCPEIKDNMFLDENLLRIK